MKIDVVMPKMGESIQEGKILRWIKKPGERVERDEIILEISTDKVDTEVPSPAAGILIQVLANENDTVEVGKTIAILETEASAAAHAPVAASPVAAPIPGPAPTIAPPAPAPVIAAPAPVIAAPAPVVAAPAAGTATDIVMPKMGESIQEGKILRWLKKPGERVERDEIILEISTDKVDTEVPSPTAGILVEVLAAENDTVEVGKVIARLGASAGTPAPVAPPAPAVAPPAPAVAPPASAVVPPAPAVAPPAPATVDIPRSSNGRFYSPLVRSIAETERVTLEELNSVTGTGLEGRVTKNDLLAYIASRGNAPSAAYVAPAVSAPVYAVAVAPAPPVTTVPAVASRPVAPINYGNDVEIIPMDRVRQLIAEHMVRSKQTSPHVTSVIEADVTAIVKLREKQKSAFEKREGFKLTLTPFFMRAIIDAVKANPMVNVSVDGKNIIRHKRINLSFATALDDGNLIVPVVKNADAMSISGMGRAVYDLSTRARNKKLAPEEIQGGTIALTNMGAWGTLFGSPVINQPQTAIVGVYAVQKRPVVREINGEDLIVIRNMVYISLTYDHRVIDGALASGFLAAMVKSLEKMNENTMDV
ncbi:MAG: 2-oxoglutarate dehydrogenase, E2 component, dihydrolipoamide succinyltransferase [Bacteroidetes bacterium]|nr:2-oxoglutarate dehydrogenase, E2 component, dihydrolipoamide succinyltransferase [Bacteroidota bacterium]MCZ2132342.1 2-oxoglutarate dehydrogenase, E2 component, dihydrolipoamide succinyltransferase [Bacteroidota bacterium]